MLADMAKSARHSDTTARGQFASRLRVCRQSGGFDTQKSFAEKIGVEEETYRRYERGETEPGIATLAKIHAALGVSLDFLIAGNLGALRLQQPAAPEARPGRPFRKRRA